MNYLLLIS